MQRSPGLSDLREGAEFDCLRPAILKLDHHIFGVSDELLIPLASEECVY